MCGIAGIAVFGAAAAPERGLLQSMCDTIIHRGPDDDGMDIRENVALGMRRLSIIDLTGGKQPIFNEDRSIRTVFNGEIYNFRELRNELESRGHRFATLSDTEVVVHAYEQYGKSFVRRLNGMFGFALHDMRRRRLLLARDPIGIKPLFYAFDGNRLVWGSEIKALLASGKVKRELDVDALGEFMAWEYVPGAGTLFKGVRKLGPGELVDIDLDRPECVPEIYWDIAASGENSAMSLPEWQEAVEAKLRECVKRQLVSDVPLGAFLSGGVDSSLIAAFMGKSRTFSIGFDDPTYSELKWSRKVAEHLGVDHETEVIKPDIADLFNQLIYFMDDPIGDFSIFPTYLVSKLARRHVTVCLSGDGGDELFGGYEYYLADEKARQYQRIPGWVRKGLLEPAIRSLKPRAAKKGLVNKAKRFVEGLEHPEGFSHARWRVFAGDCWRKRLFTTDALSAMPRPAGSHILELFQRAGKRQPLNRSLYVDVKSYLADNILVKVDRMSMAVSLEARVPYLDTELVDLAFRVPARWKLAKGETKVLLKQVASRHVPRECVYRPKEGFSIPIKNWLRTDLRPQMEELLNPRKLRLQGLFNPETVDRLKWEHQSGIANHSHILWSLMMFQAWSKEWLNGR
jgi:asparagine synthase (glutamine-hydrolysing)